MMSGQPSAPTVACDICRRIAAVEVAQGARRRRNYKWK
jgi:hypothetical protein